jgi:hypothetical protein
LRVLNALCLHGAVWAYLALSACVGRMNARRFRRCINIAQSSFATRWECTIVLGLRLGGLPPDVLGTMRGLTGFTSKAHCYRRSCCCPRSSLISTIFRILSLCSRCESKQSRPCTCQLVPCLVAGVMAVISSLSVVALRKHWRTKRGGSSPSSPRCFVLSRYCSKWLLISCFPHCAAAT